MTSMQSLFRGDVIQLLLCVQLHSSMLLFCFPSGLPLSDYAGIEPWSLARIALAARRPNHLCVPAVQYIAWVCVHLSQKSILSWPNQRNDVTGEESGGERMSVLRADQPVTDFYLCAAKLNSHAVSSHDGNVI